MNDKLVLYIGEYDQYFIFMIFIKPACGERDIVGTVSVQCLCLLLIEFVQAITSTFMHAFQNNLAQ